jgi:acyl-CoA-binding protein
MEPDALCGHDLDVAFEAATERFKALDKLSSATKLAVYALFKQARAGDAPAIAPSALAAVERAKWGAWDLLRGHTAERAKREYVARVRALGNDAQPTGHLEADGLDDDDDAADALQAELMAQIGGQVFSMPLPPEAEVATEWDGSAEGAALALLKRGASTELRALLARSPELARATDGDARSLLHWASDLGRADAARALVAAGAPLDARDADGLTALHMAAVCEHIEVLALLLEAGADPAIVDDDGDMPLAALDERFHARLRDAREAERAQRDARKQLRDVDGQMSADSARVGGHASRPSGWLWAGLAVAAVAASASASWFVATAHGADASAAIGTTYES